MNLLSDRGGAWTAWGDVTNAVLVSTQVRGARMTDVKLFKEMNAYTRGRNDCVEKENRKLVGVKWINVNIGGAKPCVSLSTDRSRSY